MVLMRRSLDSTSPWLCEFVVNRTACVIPGNGGVCTSTLGHWIYCLLWVLSCKAVLKHLVTPYLLATFGRSEGNVWQQGSSVTVLDNSIFFLENTIQMSLSSFPTTGEASFCALL